MTLPTDVVKVRLQVPCHGFLAEKEGFSVHFCEVSTGNTGFASCLLQTARSEGPSALWKGLTAALVRQAGHADHVITW